MQTNKLKQKLHSGGRVTVIAPVGTSAGLVEALGYMSFDGVFLDGEHGSGDWEEMEHMVRAADVAGYCSIVRVQRNDPAIITRALDRGAGGVQIPHINTAADALAAVQHAKYAPLGHRGWSGGRAALGVDPATFAQHANEHTLVVVMLEELEALENLDAILGVEHIDVYFVAPGDLAQSMGMPGDVGHARVQSTIDDALRRIRAAGRISGTLTAPSQLDHHMELGVQFLYVGLNALLEPGANEFIRREAR